MWFFRQVVVFDNSWSNFVVVVKSIQVNINFLLLFFGILLENENNNKFLFNMELIYCFLRQLSKVFKCLFDILIVLFGMYIFWEIYFYLCIVNVLYFMLRVDFLNW